MATKKYVWIVVPKYGKKYVVGRFSAEETAKNYVQTLNAPFNYLIKKQAVESDPEMKTNPATKKFSPAQIAAQKLFAERARAGTLGKGKRKTAVKRKANPVTETLIYGLAPGETRDYMEELMYAGGQKLTQGQIEKVFKAAGDAGYHSFRVAGFDPTMKPDFAAAVNKAIASSRSKISASEGKTIKRLLKGRHGNPDKSKPRAYVKRASQITGAPPSKRLVTRRKMALKAPAGYFPNPKAAMMTGYQVICMHPKKHVVGIFKTMAEAKMVARAMADAKGVAYGVKTVKVHKAHFAV